MAETPQIEAGAVPSIEVASELLGTTKVVMSSARQVTIDYYPESALRYLDHDAIICVDILTTTTSLVTAVTAGWRVVLGGTAAASAAKALRPVMMGDAVEGEPGRRSRSCSWAGAERVLLDCPDSPTAIEARHDYHRPLVLADGDGLDLLHNASAGPSVYVACLRNMTATAEHVSRMHRRVAVLGVCAAGTLLCEDQMAVSRIAAILRARGFEPGGFGVDELIEGWSAAEIALARLGSSAELLRRRGREADVDFVVSHIDDVDLVCRVEGSEVVSLEQSPSYRVVEAAWATVPRRTGLGRTAVASRARRLR